MGGGGVSGQFHTSAALVPEKLSGILWIGGWVGPRAVLEAVATRNIFQSLQGIKPRILITVHFTD